MAKRPLAGCVPAMYPETLGTEFAWRLGGPHGHGGHPARPDLPYVWKITSAQRSPAPVPAEVTAASLAMASKRATRALEARFGVKTTRKPCASQNASAGPVARLLIAPPGGGGQQCVVAARRAATPSPGRSTPDFPTTGKSQHQGIAGPQRPQATKQFGVAHLHQQLPDHSHPAWCLIRAEFEALQTGRWA
jgi:hypothetical protein